MKIRQLIQLMVVWKLEILVWNIWSFGKRDLKDLAIIHRYKFAIDLGFIELRWIKNAFQIRGHRKIC